MKIDLPEIAKGNFYIELKKEFKELVKQKIYKKFKTLKQFKFQINSANINLSSILEKRETTIAIWLKICKNLNINQNKLKQNILKIRTEKQRNFIRSKILPILPSSELASLLGHSLGDGHINKKDKGFEYTNKDFQLHNHVLKVIKKLFNFNNYSERLDCKGIQTRKYSKLIGYILHLAGSPFGNKITQSFLIPNWIMQGSKEIKTAFIKALFDDEGTIKTNKELLIKFSKNKKYINSLQKFTKQIKKLLEDLGIEVTSIRKGNIWYGKNGHTIQLILGLHGYKNFVKFHKDIGFNHKQKQKKLKIMINNYSSFQCKKGRNQDILYNELYNPKTIYNLMNKFNTTYITIYKNLRKLEKRNLIKRIGYNENRHLIWKKI